VQQRNPHGRLRGTGRIGWGRLLVGAAPRVWGSRAGGEDSIQGRVEAIRGTSTAGRAGGHGAGACVAPASRPPRCVTGIRQGRGKGARERGLTGRSRVAAREEVDDGPAALVG
jgi:hypothetical protein